VLQEQSFERVGSSLTLNVDVRVIATTNRDLAAAVASGDFRQDLYYRLNVLPIVVPSLRQRTDDIPLLIEHFLLQLAMRDGREPKRFDDESIELMKQYTWPGNVRELQNICERASVLSRGRIIKAGLIQPWLISPEPTVLIQPLGHPMSAPAVAPALCTVPAAMPAAAAAPATTGIRRLEEVEREQIIQTLGYFAGNRMRTAKALGIGVRTLGLKLKKWKEMNLVAQTI